MPGAAQESNNLYPKVSPINYNEVKCYDEDCITAIEAEGGMLLRSPDANNNSDSTARRTGGVTQADNVVWDERYDEPSMRAPPVKPIVCASQHGHRQDSAAPESRSACVPSGTKVLIVTFSRALRSR
jgi:hypothetical protein